MGLYSAEEPRRYKTMGGGGYKVDSCALPYWSPGREKGGHLNCKETKPGDSLAVIIRK